LPASWLLPIASQAYFINQWKNETTVSDNTTSSPPFCDLYSVMQEDYLMDEHFEIKPAMPFAGQISEV